MAYDQIKDEGWIERVPRRSAHFVVELRPFRFFPWIAYDVVVLDISTGGVKIKGSDRLRLKPGDEVWMYMHHSIKEAKDRGRRARYRMRCQWAAEEGMVGALFLDLSEEEVEALGELVSELKRMGKLLA